MVSLLDKCNDFAKLAAVSIKTVNTNDERLRELSDIKDFDDRVEFAKEQKDWELLGEGSSRVIFQISKSMVLKLAYNSAGLAQNENEMDSRFISPCTNPTLIADPEAKWIIVRKNNSITEAEFEEMVGYNFKQFAKSLFYKNNNEIHDGKPRLYNEIVQHPLFKCIAKLVLETDLQVGDISKISSWCELDGKVLLRDFGLSKDIWKKYYNSEGNATSTI